MPKKLHTVDTGRKLSGQTKQKDMKANELRIGNWVMKDHEVFESTEHTPLIMIRDGERFEPIPLTEKWLNKFGFTKYQWTDAYFIHTKFGDLMIRFIEGKIYTFFTNVYSDQNGMMMKGSRYVGNINNTQNIHSVHQLQNLYFALTGQEL